jgi:peptidyl-Lys metalloendopeptidase
MTDIFLSDLLPAVSNAYDFDSDGVYDVEPSTTFYYVGSNGEPTEIEATLVNAHSTKVSGDLASSAIKKRKENYNKLRKRAATTSGCTSAQTEQIIQSTYVASLYAVSAEKYLTLKTSTTDRFVQWFGEYDSGHHDTVLTHYTNIRSSDLKTYTYD